MQQLLNVNLNILHDHFIELARKFNIAYQFSNALKSDDH